MDCDEHGPLRVIGEYYLHGSGDDGDWLVADPVELDQYQLMSSLSSRVDPLMVIL